MQTPRPATPKLKRFTMKGPDIHSFAAFVHVVSIEGRKIEEKGGERGKERERERKGERTRFLEATQILGGNLGQQGRRNQDQQPGNTAAQASRSMLRVRRIGQPFVPFLDSRLNGAMGK